MLKKIRALLQEVSAYITFWPLVGGAVMALVSGRLAYVTAALEPYAPFSWLAAGLIGALVFMIILLAGAAFRNWVIVGNTTRRFYEQGDRINPLETHFKSQRIRVEDLAPPVGFEISNKTFVECEIVGPANILMEGCSLQHSGFNSIDCILAAKTATIRNALVFKNCTFLRCNFFKITLYVWEAHKDDFENGTAGVKWVNPV